MKRFVVLLGHDQSALYDHPGVYVVDNLDQAADVVERFMVQYGFKVVDGELLDPDGHPGDSQDDNFMDVKWHDGRPIGFVHCEGQGPIAKTHKER